MQLITSAQEVYELIDRVKLNSHRVITNFFVTELRLNSWIAKGELFSYAQCDNLWLFRRDRDFFHLHYVSPGIDILRSGVEKLVTRFGATIFSVDVLGRENEIMPIVNIFRENHFCDHLYLNRMKKIVKERRPPEVSRCPEAEFAGQDDADAVMCLLETSFDKFAEQLPDIKEIREAIDKKTILIVRKDGVIAGMLYFEMTGLTSVLRYWFVDQRYRELKIGSKLMWHYFDICNQATCFILWVITDNENAIKRYIHYGYNMDYLMDQILVNKGNNDGHFA